MLKLEKENSTINFKAITIAGLGAVGVLIAKAAPFALGYAGGHAIVTAMQPSLHERLVQAAQAMALPKRIDEGTVLEHVTIEGLQWVYSYSTDYVALNADAKATFAARVCAAPDMVKTMADGVSYRYDHQHNGSQIGSFVIDRC
jgi:hypothetical protein